MRKFTGFERGMGIGGWLTNYKRFNVLPQEWRLRLSPGDFEHFDTYITRDDVARIAASGFDHVRLGFDQIVLEEAPGRYRERIWQVIDRFLDWCDACGIGAVLNLHKAIGNYCDIKEERSLLDDSELRERFAALWIAFEERYSGRPDVAFELLNEVRDVPPEQWNSLARETVGAIRRRNPERKIIVGGVRWNAPDAIRLLPEEFDRNVVFTWHNYAPFEFTHQRGVLQAPTLFYNRTMPYPGDIEIYRDFHRFVWNRNDAYAQFRKMDIEVLRDATAPAFDYAAAHPERIIWCGEFGTIRHCPLVYRENYMADMIRLLQEHRMPYCVWNYLSTPNDGNRFSLVDDDTREILSPRLAEILVGKL